MHDYDTGNDQLLIIQQECLLIQKSQGLRRKWNMCPVVPLPKLSPASPSWLPVTHTETLVVSWMCSNSM